MSFLFSVAYGACVQAAVLAGKQDVQPMYVRNVTPLTIGVISSNPLQECFPLIKKNSAYPVDKIIHGKTKRDNQTNAKIIIYEGEQQTKNANEILGSMIMSGLTASPKGVEVIDIHVKLDDKGIISATAVDQRTKLEESIIIDKPQRFTEDEILEMIKTHSKLSMIAVGAGVEASVADNSAIEITLPDEECPEKRLKLGEEKDIDGGANPEANDEACPIYGQQLGQQLGQPETPLVLELDG